MQSDFADTLRAPVLRMALARAQAAECAPVEPNTGAQPPHALQHKQSDSAHLLSGREYLWQVGVQTGKTPLAVDDSNYVSAGCSYKQALAANIDECTLACSAGKTAFEAYLHARDFTAESKAFMHAELAHLLHTMRADDRSVAHSLTCPPHVRALLASVPVLAQALLVLCEQASSRHVFDLFLSSTLEHMVLIEDVIASGGTVRNAREQHCARYLQDWTQAVAQLGRSRAQSILH
jgi:hypothetical protein